MAITESVFIKVFPTKSGKFRARVDEPSGSVARKVSEVTIGGFSWKNGKLSKYHGRIMEKLQMVMYNYLGEFFITSGSPTNISILNGKSVFLISHEICK